MSAADPSWGPREDLDVLDRDIPRVDGAVKATGRAVYTHDVRVPGMLWARLLLCPFPRATVESIDVAPAEALPGVAYAAALKEPGDEVRYSGEDGVLAVVAAETPEQAEDALAAIIADVERAEPVVSPEQAKADGAPIVNRRPGATSNVDRRNESGDEAAVEAAFAGAAAIVERTYEIPVQHHVCLETHGHVVEPIDEDGEVLVHASTQAVSGLPRALAGAFERGGRIRVVTPHMGGGFGSKFGPGREGAVCAQVAEATGRPVHLMLTRADEFAMAGNRSGSKQTLKLGASDDGGLVALRLDAERYGGVGGGALPRPPYIYRVEGEASVMSRIASVHTATDSSRAMRAPGHPQASFAMESAVDELAYELGMDPVDIRVRNLESPVHHRQLERAAEEIGWYDHPHHIEPGTPDETGRAVGIGFGVSVWSPGGRGSTCDVTVHPDGSVVSATATQDLGTGARTYVAAIVAEELGLTVDQVTPRIGDSSLPPSVASGGSVTTGSSAPAIKDAAHRAREALEERVSTVLEAPVGGYVWKGGRVMVRDDPDRSLAWIEVCALLREPLVARGQFQASLYEGNVHGAQAAKVEVDAMTGRVRVVKMVAVQDQGLPLNRLALRSQINGGMIQALSFGLLEQRSFDEQYGYLVSDNLDVYRIAGAQEMPEFVTIIDDEDQRPAVGGMAEAPVIPGHSAIANAIYNACGVRLTRMPFTPANVLEALYGKV
ncbi:MAG: xanthine dehydrogenase family protein molybdopterin-binding subunit [Planctomycetota bacterium]